MNTLTSLLLVRHGETQWNIADRFQGQLDSPLTELGIQQAQLLQQQFIDQEIHIAYSSPLSRAVTTCALILNGRAIKMHTRSRLAEMQLGPWQGKTQQEITKSHPQQLFYFWSEPSKYQLDGAESYNELKLRVVSEIKQIFEDNLGKNILVVSHGLVIRVLLASLSNHKKMDVASIDVPENGNCINLKYQNGHIFIA